MIARNDIAQHNVSSGKTRVQRIRVASWPRRPAVYFAGAKLRSTNAGLDDANTDVTTVSKVTPASEKYDHSCFTASDCFDIAACSATGRAPQRSTRGGGAAQIGTVLVVRNGRRRHHEWGHTRTGHTGCRWRVCPSGEYLVCATVTALICKSIGRYIWS